MTDCHELKKLVDNYAVGRLDSSQQLRVEKHLLECPDCRSRVDDLLQPAQELLRAQTVEQSAPAHVFERAMNPKRAPKWFTWGVLPGLPALAVALYFVFFLNPALPVTRVEGIVLVDGRLLAPGGGLRDGAFVQTIGRAAFSMQGLTVSSCDAYNEFRIERKGPKWLFKNPLVALDFVHRGKSVEYGAFADGNEFQPAGTRFRVESGGTVDVYENSVTVIDTKGQLVCNTGYQLVRRAAVPVNDDPTVVLPGAVPTEFVGPTRGPYLAAGEISSTARQAIAELFHDRGRAAYIPVALVLVGERQPRAAEACVMTAIHIEPTIPHASVVDVVRMVKYFVCNGHQAVARELALIYRSRTGGSFGRDWDILVNATDRTDVVTPLVSLLEREMALGALDVAAMLLDKVVDARGRTMAVEAADAIIAKVAKRLELFPHREDNDFSVAELADMHGLTGDALYYIPGREADSLNATLTCSRLGQRASEVIHACARRSEIGEPTATDRLTVFQAFNCDPTWRSAERVLTYLRDTVRSKADAKVSFAFAKWCGQTYTSVMQAQVSAASQLVYTDPDTALGFLRRALEIAGSTERLGRSRELLARLTYFHAPESQRNRQAIVEDAKASGLIVGTKFVSGAYRYFEEAGEFGLALAALREDESKDLDAQSRLVTKARYLVALKAPAEAVAALRERLAIGPRDSSVWEFDDYECRLALAELVAASDPSQARALASQVVSHGFSDAARGWRRAHSSAQSYRARALWLLGRRTDAIAVLRSALALWPDLGPSQSDDQEARLWFPDRKRDRERLQDWGMVTPISHPPK